MATFVKIYGSKLITSSLWDEPPEARLVFLAMLALADYSGYVDVPNERALARVLNLEEAYVVRALEILTSPDKGSRSPDLEGRRVVREGSGWRCVNHGKYRDCRTPAQEATRIRVAEWREKNSVTRNNVTTGNGVKHSVRTDLDQDRDQDRDPEGSGSGESQARPLANARSLSPRGGPKPYPEAFEAVWKAVGEVGHLGNSIKGEAFTAWKAIGAPADAWQIQARWAAYVASLPEYQTTPKHFGRWLKARGHEQDYESPIVDLVAKAEAKQKRADDELRAGIEAERRKEARR